MAKEQVGMNRTQLREQIFKLLFRIEFNPEEEMPEQVKLFFLDNDDINFEEEDEAYIINKYNSIVAAIPMIDAKIEEKSEGWSKNRIGKVELTILRQAIYEILEDESVPAGVAINEAVNLAKQFGQEQAGSYINGVLAKFVE